MHEPRILAIDLRSQRFGFAVFAGPRRLLDCGRKNCNITGTTESAIVARKTIIPLLTLFAPSVIVMKRVSGLRGVARLRSKEFVEAIRREAQERSLELIFLKRSDVRRVFRQSGKRSKDQIAAWIAGFFPELGWKLPANRQNWQPEHHNITIFDAVSLGVTYFAQIENHFPANLQEASTHPPG